MKKMFFSVSVLFALLFALPVYAGNINVTIEGQPVLFTDQQPTGIDGRTLVPVRGVFETLGFTVDWEAETSTAVLTNADYAVRITLESTTFTTNGINFTLDVPAQSMGGRTMLPLRAVLESVGYFIGWNGTTSTVLISSQPIPEQPTAPPVTPTTPVSSSSVIIVDGLTWDISDDMFLFDENNVLQVSAEIISAAFGAFVDWDASRQRVSFVRRSSEAFEEVGTREVQFRMNTDKYFVSTRGTNGTESFQMSTLPQMAGETPYVPLTYLAQAFEATVYWEQQANGLVITITSRTKRVDVFDIPQTYSDHYRIIEDVDEKYILFGVGPQIGLENRLKILTHMLSQQLDESSIRRLQEFFAAHDEHKPTDVHDHLVEIFPDPATGRYVRMLRLAIGGFNIVIYYDGYIPTE